MAKLTLSNLASLENQVSAMATINANSDLIETALENTLSRDGTSPNTMGASLDMNSNRILNLIDATTNQEPVTLSQLVDAEGSLGISYTLASPASTYNTKAEATAATVPVDRDYLWIAGYTTVGDGGAAFYKEVALQPSHDGKIQDTGGRWFEIVDEVLRPEMFGGFADNSSDAAVAANKALLVLDARTTGGTLKFSGCGTYLLNTTGATTGYAGHKCCINIPCDNIHIIIESQATLKLANSQQTDAGGAVEIIYCTGTSRKNIHITVDGKITGNTAGQSGWTTGYNQILAGCIIHSRCISGDGFIVDGTGSLEDHWSNPVNVSGLSNKNAVIRGVRGKDCGEGFQLIGTDGWVMENLFYEDTTGVATGKGDAFEASATRNGFAKSLRVKASSNPPVSAALDLFGSRHIRVEGLIVEGWSDGVSAATPTGSTVTMTIASPGVISLTSHLQSIGDPIIFSTTGALPTGITAETVYYVITAGFGANSFQISATPNGTAINTSGTQSGVHTGRFPADDIQVSDAVFINATTGTSQLGEAEGRIIYNHCKVNGGTSAQFAQIGGAVGLPPITLNDCFGDGCSSMIITGARRVVWHGGGIKNATGASQVGVYFETAASEARNIDFKGLTFEGNSLADFYFNTSSGVIAGAIEGCRLLSTTPLTLGVDSATTYTGLTAKDIEFAAELTNNAADNSFALALRERLIRSTTNFATIKKPHKNQRLLVTATGGFSVIDASEAGGDNILLAGGANFVMAANDTLSLFFNGTSWLETARSDNSP